MEKTRRIHPRYLEFQRAKEAGISVHQIFGKYQFFRKSPRGEISMISLPGYLHPSETRWEIYCLEGGLFEDIETFSTKKEAEKRVKQLLT